MSWDLFVQDLPLGIRDVNEIPDDFEPAPLGPRAWLIEQIRAFIPAVDFRDPVCGRFDGPGFSVEFSMGEASAVESVRRWSTYRHRVAE